MRFVRIGMLVPKMSIDSLALVTNISFSLIAALLLVKIWRRDVFFAIFFSFLVLYSIVAIWGYLIYPELSGLMLNMYFGVPPLIFASWFTLLSLGALYVGYWLIYKPVSRAVRFDLRKSKPLPGPFIFIAILFACALAFGYGYYKDVLSYANASDEEFLISAGLNYKIFWLLYKFSTFMLLILYALIRSREFRLRIDRLALLLVAYAYGLLFILITVAVGSRTDPLALALGILAYEYYFRRFFVRRIIVSNVRKAPSSVWSPVVKISGFLFATIAALTALEIVRNGGAITRDDLETSVVAQAVLLKDYYWPFHVLIGAISHNYIDPVVAVASNFGNALMFVGVDYLQNFVVDQWASGSVTRTAGPAMYAFTEGFVMFGGFGFIYNGIVWALGISLWRLFSRSNDEAFNALAFSMTAAVAATVARTQSSYFVKDTYLWFLPAFALYAIAAGVRIRALKIRKMRAGSGAQIAASR